MKPYLFMLTAVSLAGPVAAQTERGAKLLGASVGDLSYTTYKTPISSKRLAAAVYPAVGWFVLDRLAVGTGVLLSYERQRHFFATPNLDQWHITDREIGYGVAPFVRYYLLGRGKHQLFAQASPELAWYRARVSYSDDTPNYYSQRRTVSLTGLVGYNYFLTPGVALEVAAGYQRQRLWATTMYSNQPPRQNTLETRLGLAFFLPTRSSE